MKIKEIISESTNTPIIVVDVQPAYAGEIHGPHKLDMVDGLARFLGKHKGKVLMLVNAEQDAYTDDNISQDIIPWWQDVFLENHLSDDVIHNWEWFDKGYGYLRAWMDNGVPESEIIRTIREMYSQGVSDSRDLFKGDVDQLEDFLGDTAEQYLIIDDPLTVEWISVSKLREYNGGYIVGGAKDACLKEVQLIMNAFNIKYKVIDKFVYY